MSSNSIFLGSRNEYRIQVYRSIEEVKSLWVKNQPNSNIFLQYMYLSDLERCNPEKMTFYYLVYFAKDEVIGLSYAQTYHINVDESLNQGEKELEVNNCVISAFTQAIKSWFLRKADFNFLICGNLLLTGEHAYHFNEQINPVFAKELYAEAVDKLHEYVEKQGNKVHIIFHKDYTEGHAEELGGVLKPNQYFDFLMQPSMYMNVRENWLTFPDYLADMSSKYRVRAKRAAKKMQGIESRALTFEEIEANEDRIHYLYRLIAENAGFNAFILHKSYFSVLKKSFGEDFQFIGHYHEGELIAFHTTIVNYKELEAHFLGFDSSYNKSHQIYLNILYQIIETAIDHKMQRIHFARTALEIKSSVGAVGQEMVCFLKHRNSISSKILNSVFDYLNPKEEWQPRSPFKEKQVVKV